MTNRKFQVVTVLMGGPSAERAVSLNSGRAIANALRDSGHTVHEVDVQSHDLMIPADTDAVFIALHGEFGEDGGVQALLDERGIPYTGAGPESSRKAFDKEISKTLFASAGIPTPPYEILSAGQPRTLALPVVTKPLRQGSSIGIHRVFDEADWPESFADTLTFDERALVESFIPGAELTVGIVGARVLPVIEIRAPEGYYNYSAKYTVGQTVYRVPAPITDEQTRQCQDCALRAYRVLECRGMGRVDLRMTPEGDLYVLELNTIPGFTETSLLPKAARAAGIEFPELCERILNMAQVNSTIAG